MCVFVFVCVCACVCVCVCVSVCASVSVFLYAPMSRSVSPFCHVPWGRGGGGGGLLLLIEAFNGVQLTAGVCAREGLVDMPVSTSRQAPQPPSCVCPSRRRHLASCIPTWRRQHPSSSCGTSVVKPASPLSVCNELQDELTTPQHPQRGTNDRGPAAVCCAPGIPSPMPHDAGACVHYSSRLLQM